MTSQQRTEIVLAGVVAPDGLEVRTTSMPTGGGKGGDPGGGHGRLVGRRELGVIPVG